MSPRSLRQIILEQSKRAHVGHVGCSLSIADIVATLYGDILNVPSPDDPERDRLVLSKGHAALALYAALFLKGWITADDLDTYCADASLLGVHPERCLAGVDFSTGSLGQGLSFGAGAALAAHLQASLRRVFVLSSDAEMNEGSFWEAAMFAAHHRLVNLTLIVDLNGQQAFGYTRDVLNLPNLPDRWRAFGWDVHEVDGHNTGEIAGALRSCAPGGVSTLGAPHILLARTTFGKGVSYMEREIAWHYLPMTDDLYRQARGELGGMAR